MNYPGGNAGPMAMLVLLTGLLVSTVVPARVEIIEFDDPGQRALYDEIIAELRCLVCQNQNLEDSNAELAVDLRRRTRELIEQGKSRKEIADYMVARYGEFVLYRPPLTAANLLLWFGPGLLLGLVLIITLYRRNKHKPGSQTLSEPDRRRVRRLLEDESV